MEVQYGHMLDAQVHMQRHRVGARGNATSFLLPWEALLHEFRKAQNCKGGKGIALPRTGQELSDIVQVLLKANDYESQEKMKNFVHQAKVRRDVVVRHILAAKARRHRGYLHVDENSVIERAQSLPENGVPDAVCHLLANDDALSKIVVQKAATPVEGRSAEWNEKAGQAFSAQRPNAVVLEKSSVPELDSNLLQKNAFLAVASAVQARSSGI